MKRIRLIIATLFTLVLAAGMLISLGGERTQASEKAANGRNVDMTTESGLQLSVGSADDSWATVVGYVGNGVPDPKVVKILTQFNLFIHCWIRYSGTTNKFFVQIINGTSCSHNFIL